MARETGPFSLVELKQMARDGRLKPDDSVREAAEGSPYMVARAAGLFDNAPAVPPPRARNASAETGWFRLQEGQESGPVPFRSMQEAASRGELQPDDLIWHGASGQMMPAAMVPSLRFGAQAAPPSAEESLPPLLKRGLLWAGGIVLLGSIAFVAVGQLRSAAQSRTLAAARSCGDGAAELLELGNHGAAAAECRRGLKLLADRPASDRAGGMVRADLESILGRAERAIEQERARRRFDELRARFESRIEQMVASVAEARQPRPLPLEGLAATDIRAVEQQHAIDVWLNLPAIIAGGVNDLELFQTELEEIGKTAGLSDVVAPEVARTGEQLSRLRADFDQIICERERIDARAGGDDSAVRAARGGFEAFAVQLRDRVTERRLAVRALIDDYRSQIESPAGAEAAALEASIQIDWRPQGAGYGVRDFVALRFERTRWRIAEATSYKLAGGRTMDRLPGAAAMEFYDGVLRELQPVEEAR
jgi:hypothetical protein